MGFGRGRVHPRKYHGITGNQADFRIGGAIHFQHDQSQDAVEIVTFKNLRVSAAIVGENIEMAFSPLPSGCVSLLSRISGADDDFRCPVRVQVSDRQPHWNYGSIPNHRADPIHGPVLAVEGVDASRAGADQNLQCGVIVDVTHRGTVGKPSRKAVERGRVVKARQAAPRQLVKRFIDHFPRGQHTQISTVNDPRVGIGSPRH